MKRIIPLLASLVCSCTQVVVETAPADVRQMSFTAIFDPETKTTLQEGRHVRWSASDAVSLFASTGTKGSIFKVSSLESGGAVATFTGQLPESTADCYYALYPASNDARLVSAEGTLSCGIPTAQKGVENSFDPAAALSMASVASGGSVLSFKNAGALLSFTVPGNWVTRIKIESLDESVAMTGPASISYNDGKPVVAPSESAKNYVELSVPEGSIGKTYYTVVYPGDYSGFRVSFYTSVNYYNRYTSSKSLSLKRNDNVSLIRKNWGTNDDRASSESGYETVTDPVSVSINSTSESYYNFVVNYTVAGVSSADLEHGLVFSYDNSNPTCGAVGEAGKLRGPAFESMGTSTLMQCVPNSCLRPGETCYLRAYCYDSDAGSYTYSTVQELVLYAQPNGCSISKTAISSPSENVSLYSFKANDTWSGYVAEADCSASGPIRLGVHNAAMGKTSAVSMASQLSSSGALVLVNGQIFGTQGNIGLAYTGGQLRYNNSSDDGISACRGYGNTYSDWQPVTRAIIGVDANGVPGAYWCTLINGTAYFFDRPIPAGTAVYPQVTSSSGPGPARNWKPQEALSTGPMLLYGGKVCVSEEKLKTGVYYTNYELWETTSGNIYGSSRQRTAIGYNSSTGKWYLAVVTSNITITAMALVMKGLGCDYAMNLDGGGSVQMQVSGTGALTSNTRSVKSTIGFSQK